ncbi:hypothetical protein Sjap_002616 [Stephania japonica]|uniref:Uncharacterized protein n=1 Tax=Stephania japonica TaxID=461633 RepID=A0AAP0KM69_9MAGN
MRALRGRGNDGQNRGPNIFDYIKRGINFTHGHVNMLQHFSHKTLLCNNKIIKLVKTFH